MSAEGDVLFELRGHAGLITLNRAKALNALTLEMVRAMDARLRAWAQDAQVRAVVIQGAGERAFCAGGDIRALYDSGRAGTSYVIDFYAEEYALNTLIKRFPKPYVALINGIVMGGGVGVSVHGQYRAGGEKTLFAMPECGIGLFPDVGGTYFLPRLPRHFGAYLGLTGARAGQSDALALGILTHAVPVGRHGAVIAALAEGEPAGQVLERERADVAPSAMMAHADEIEAAFSASSVEEICARLAMRGTDFAKAAITALQKASPTSLKVVHRQLREGARLDFGACMRLEFRLTNRFMRGYDFYEGVRAQIIEKDFAPRWKPAALSEVSAADVDAYFAPLPQGDLAL